MGICPLYFKLGMMIPETASNNEATLNPYQKVCMSNAILKLYYINIVNAATDLLIFYFTDVSFLFVSKNRCDYVVYLML